MPEFQGLPPNPEVERRTEELAKAHAKQQTAAAEAFLKPYVRQPLVRPQGPTYLNPNDAACIIKNEYDQAKRILTTERNAGLHNDLESTVAHGVTALIFGEAVRYVEELFPEDERSAEMPVLEPLGENSTGHELFSLRFSKGHYRIPREVVVPVVDFFPTETEPTVDPQITTPHRGPAEPMPWVIPNPAEKPIDQRVLWLPQSTIVRIQADGGELWQNPNFTPLGVPVAAS